MKVWIQGFLPVPAKARTTRLICLITGLLLALAAPAWADQRGDVCQGSCGGGCPCSSGGNQSGNGVRSIPEPEEEEEPPAPDPKEIEFNNLVAEAQGAESLDVSVPLIRRALALREDSNLRNWLNTNQAVIAGDAAFNVHDYEHALAYYRQAAVHPEYAGPGLSKAIAELESHMRYMRQQAAIQSVARTLGETVKDQRSSMVQAAPGLDFMRPPPPVVPVEPPVVDARDVPSGLPKSVAEALPHSPAGDRVRKGFQAIQDKDWKVASAWFQDALNHDPGNEGIIRLVDLAQFTLQKQAAPSDEATQKVLAILDRELDDAMEQSLRAAMDDFNRNYLPAHPELGQPQSTSATEPALKTDSAEPGTNWQAFFDALFKPEPKQPKRPTSVGAVKD